MPRINVPDYNTYVDFPDGTPADVMEKAMLETFPAKDFSKVSFKQDKPASTLGISTPRQQEEAKELREVVTGKEVVKRRGPAIPELRNAPQKNFFEQGVDAVRGALSPYHDSESMDPGEIASAAISMDAQKNVVPAKTITAEGVQVNIPARSMGRDEFVDMINPEGKGVRAVEKFVGGVGRGAKDVATGALGALQALGSKPAANAANALQADSLNSPQDESLSGELGSGFGSLLTFMIPAIGVSKAASLAAKLSPTAAKYAAAGTMTAFEAATEGGNVFREMVAGGASEEEASKAATKTFLANLPLNFITDKAAFFPDGGAKGLAKHVVNSAVPEGLQEGSQEYISQRSQPGKEVSGTDILKSAAIGALTGGVVGGAKASISTDHDMLSGSPSVDQVAPVEAPQAAAQPAVDPLDAHMAARQAEEPEPQPAPVAEEPEPQAEAIQEPAPQDVPVNTVFKQPDGSTVKIAAKRAKEGGYVLNTTTITADGHSQTVSSHDPVSGNDVLAAIEQARPSKELPAAPEGQPTAATVPDLTRQEWADSQVEPVELAAAPEVVSELDAAAHESAASPTNETPVPTQAQTEAGNYKKGHVNIQGLNIAIENPQGSKRSGEDADGNPWETEMQDHYGYIKGTVGKDKDHIDVFVKPGLTTETTGERVFVVDQVDPKTGELDEHKVMLGYDSQEAAQAAYLRNYDQTGADRIGAITETTSADFKEWLKHGDTKREFVPVNKKEPVAPTPVQEQVASPTLTLEEIGAEGMNHDSNTKGEVIILKAGKNIAQQDRKTGMWRVYEGGLSAKNMVGDNFTMREAAEELKGMREPKEREAEKRQGGFGFDTGGYAARTSPSRWQTTQTFLELPEMVRLYKLINDGKLPKLVERMGNALGRLTHNRTGEADIKLRKDLFAGPQIANASLKPAEARQKWAAWQKMVQNANADADIIFRQKYNRKTGKIDFKAYKRDPNYVLKIFAHEIGHFVDFLPDSIVRGRGNILGHIAALKKYAKDTLEMYPDAPGKTLSSDDMNRLQAEALDDATMDAGAVTETITREVPKYSDAGVTPEMITEIWNGMADAREKNPDLYKFIAKMSDAEKKSVVVKAMKGLVHESLKNLGKVQVGTETITETTTRYAKPTAAEVKARLDELVQEEIGKRRLYEKTRITDELKKLTQLWKPFTPGNDAYTKYRHSSSELYADAVSVLFNEPQLLKDTAPTFYKAFFYYMGERPTFKEAYKALSRLSKDPLTLGAERYEDEMEMYGRGSAKAEQIRKDKPAHEKTYDTLMRTLVDKNHDILKDLPKTKEGDKARFMLEEIAYLGGEIENYARKPHEIKTKIEAAGLTINDLSAYMLAQHIIENRSDIANTQGKTAATEKAKLEYMKVLHGTEKMDLLESAADDFRDARKHILKRMEESEIVTDDLMEKINERQHYAHIDVQHYMDEKFGEGTATGAGWKKVAEGTLSDVNNVFTATVLQDMAILRMAKINESKRALTDVFAGSGLAVKAAMKWDKNFGGKRPVDPGGDKALLTVMVKGKPVYFVVDKHVADTYKHSLVKAMAIGKIAGYIQTYFRDILVSKNPAWMLRNVYRDMKGTVKNNSEIAWWNPMDRLRLLREYKRAFTEVRADIMKGERSSDIEMMHNEHMLNAERAWSGQEGNYNNEMERIAAEFQFGEQESANAAMKQLTKAYSYLEKLGKISEQTSKVGGMKYLRSKGVTGDELAHKVRTVVGTPDYKRQGTLQQFSNNIFMFSNVGKEGIRSAYSAYKADPLSYAFKTIEMNVLPKILLSLAAAGAFGDELKELALKIPSWDRRMFTIIPVPDMMIRWAKDARLIGQDANAYLRLPQDYEGQFFGALAYDIVQGDVSGVAKDLIGAQPYKLHPMLALVVDWGQYLSGSQPYDSFRQKDVLTREQQQYGEVQGLLNKKSLAGMGIHTYGMLGLGNIYKLDNKEFPKDQTAFERLLKITPVNAIGSYLQVNDAGRQEQLVKLIRDGRNEKSIQSYEIGDAINEAVRDGRTRMPDMLAVFKTLRAEGKLDKKANFGRFRARYERAIAQEEHGIKPTSRAEEKIMSEAP